MAGKSCKIRPMVAYFSSKLSKQIRAVLMAILIAACLLGTHWTGLSHSISHAGNQTQTLELKSSNIVDKSVGHSSDACHLFDTLSLAGFIPTPASEVHTIFASPIITALVVGSYRPSLEIASYQSRAPPTFIL